MSGQSLAAEPDPAQALAAMLGKFAAIHARFVQWVPDDASYDETAEGAFYDKTAEGSYDKPAEESFYDKTAEGSYDKTAEGSYDKPAEGSAPDKPLQPGEFWLQKPDKFRVETGPPLSQTVVSDGMSLWTHDRDLEQVIITRFEADAARLPVLLLAGSASDIADVFSVTRDIDNESNEKSQRTRFLLIPHDDKGVLTSVAIVFEQSIPRRIILRDAMQQRTIIELSDVNLAPAVTGTEFLFTTDAPVDVIDDRD